MSSGSSWGLPRQCCSMERRMLASCPSASTSKTWHPEKHSFSVRRAHDHISTSRGCVLTCTPKRSSILSLLNANSGCSLQMQDMLRRKDSSQSRSLRRFFETCEQSFSGLSSTWIWAWKLSPSPMAASTTATFRSPAARVRISAAYSGTGSTATPRTKCGRLSSHEARSQSTLRCQSLARPARFCTKVVLLPKPIWTKCTRRPPKFGRPPRRSGEGLGSTSSSCVSLEPLKGLSSPSSSWSLPIGGSPLQAPPQP
mmetsp:Transcript_11380/g.35650  ORF Transcript_11380/g.35650 Transcript_11380/m.35650 type:complete len:255 (-) Transcript_11380:56-820(-)